jgi:3,4-dihydroxy 2-butanone 4-phosphate synthase/GTP cyclohydrolase II
MLRIATIAEAIDDIRRGQMVILVDDEDRENEGDLVIAAEKISARAINFMAVTARGLICVALPSERLDAIGLPPMARHNTAPLGTAFTASVDAAHLTTAGISAQDRSETVLTLMRDDCTRSSLRVPGHTMPLRGRRGGVLVRPGQTEGSIDLARLAGLKPAGVICEIMNPDGTMMRLDGLLKYGQEHGIKVVTIADLIRYRMQKESLVRAVADVELPTDYGTFRSIAYKNEVDTQVHIALVKGDIDPETPTLVRVHRADLVADVLGHIKPGGLNRLDSSLRTLAAAESGVLLYLRTGSNGEMAVDPLRAVLGRRPKTKGPIPMDFREFGVGAQILSDIGLKKLRIMSNQPFPLHALSGFGLEVVEWVPLESHD